MKANLSISLAEISETDLENMKSEIIKLRDENKELKSQNDRNIEALEQQSQELGQLQRLAKVVLSHFDDFLNTGCHVDRCIACGKCDYEILGQALLPFKDMRDR